MTPSDSLSAVRHFPGSPVIDGRTPHPRRTRAEEGLSSSHDGLLDVPRSIRRGVLEHPLQDPGCLPWPSPISLRARRSLFPALAGYITTLQASLDVADRQFASTPLRTRHFGRPRGFRYQGPWRLPGPDSHRLVVVSFSLGYVMIAPLQSGRPSRWTHRDVCRDTLSNGLWTDAHSL
jgi:hypothetical protein